MKSPCLGRHGYCNPIAILQQYTEQHQVQHLVLLVDPFPKAEVLQSMILAKYLLLAHCMMRYGITWLPAYSNGQILM